MNDVGAYDVGYAIVMSNCGRVKAPVPTIAVPSSHGAINVVARDRDSWDGLYMAFPKTR